MDVSIIIPIHNGSQWIDPCFKSIQDQTIHNLKVEICVCNDSSTDNTPDLLEKWRKKLVDCNLKLLVYNNESETPGGVGFSKNRAIGISSGKYLCFQDVDDVMLPGRIWEQYNAAQNLTNDFIIGSKFVRQPADSTVRYTNWANNLSHKQLNTQVYTSNGPTVIMPTWFCHRSVFQNIGGFSEGGKGEPEDLIFFYKHLDLDGKIFRVDKSLLIYTYHLNAATHSIHEDTIWKLRIEQLQVKVLKHWDKISIWNAGKQGRKFYKSLSEENRQKVIAMCDVDVNKIGKYYTPFDAEKRTNLDPIKIIHFSQAVPPIVICVKMEMTNGCFEDNLKSLGLEEDKDYVYFS